MDDLVAWLRQQIKMDGERTGRILGLAESMYAAWQSGNPYSFAEQADDVRDEYIRAATVAIDEQMPGIQAECEAKRRIVELHKPSWSDGKPEYDTHEEQTANGAWVDVRDAEPRSPYWCLVCQDFTPCPTVRVYGELYAKLGRPGYQESWRVE